MEKNLEQIKQEYQKLQEKYNLPSFEELNKDFGIEKAVETETDYLIREIRKFIADKFSNYLRFIETLLQPANAPMFVYSVVKTYGEEEKEKLTEAYKKLARAEVDLVEVDLEFNEEKEAQFIKDTFIIWQEVKKEILEVMQTVKKNWNNKSKPNGKGYFG